MKPFKYIFLLTFTVIISSGLFAQRMGNQQGRRQQQQQRQGMSEKGLLSPEAMTEIVFYDAEKVFKRIKLKDKDKKKVISNAIVLYNNKLTEINGFAFLEFKMAKKLIAQTKENAKLENDPNLMKDAKEKLRTILSPIKKKVKIQQNKLDIVFKKELTEKQYAKWLKHKKTKIEALKPKLENKPQMKSNLQRQRGQGQRRRY